MNEECVSGLLKHVCKLNCVILQNVLSMKLHKPPLLPRLVCEHCQVHEVLIDKGVQCMLSMDSTELGRKEGKARAAAQ